MYYDYININVLEGKFLINIETDNSEYIIFSCSDGSKYKMYHEQDCCEGVGIEDICGDLKDLLNQPILLAEEVTFNNENPENIDVPDYQESFTWTFYKLATNKGYVTIRWYGESNGYYSESVSFVQIAADKNII